MLNTPVLLVLNLLSVPRAGVRCTLTPGVLGAFSGEENMSARNWGAGDEGGEESSAHRGAAGREEVPGVNPTACFCFRAVCGVAAMRYVLSSTRCSSGSVFVGAAPTRRCVAVGMKGEEVGVIVMSGSACALPGVIGSGPGDAAPPWTSRLSAS